MELVDATYTTTLPEALLLQALSNVHITGGAGETYQDLLVTTTSSVAIDVEFMSVIPAMAPIQASSAAEIQEELQDAWRLTSSCKWRDAVRFGKFSL